jgi:hypothetical protein
MNLKKCYKCDTLKEVSEFNKNKSKKDGLSGICKKCHKEYRRIHYLNNKEKVLEQVNEYRKKNPNKKSKRLTNREPNKKAGRIFERECSIVGCDNIIFVTRKDLSENNDRYCSLDCRYKQKASPYKIYLGRVKKRARVRKLKFNLDSDFIEELLVNQGYRCAITNSPIEFKGFEKETTIYDSASLDRIDNKRGYVKDNVQWVMLGVNYMKLNYPEEDLHKALNLIIENYNNNHTDVD